MLAQASLIRQDRLEGEKVDRKSMPDRAGEIQKTRHGKRQCWLDRAGEIQKTRHGKRQCWLDRAGEIQKTRHGK
jgi:hypothetical protein